ncbi:MAG: MoxR family ATPase [Desulfobacterales bacterium]|nr:MoxR family ATPase [Desulfobacterales bacterium]
MKPDEAHPPADRERTAPAIIRGAAERFRSNVAQAVIGRPRTIDLIFVALLCEGHVLIEDVPGVGKTLLARATARSLACSFKRIQCTPDLLPSDVVGLHVFNQKSAEFEYRPGPVVANVVLVDEINRAMPRTQSSLLECMQERQVTIDWKTVELPRPFMIMATQNPIELEGTFPLPEAQLDRFLLKLKLGYPSQPDESSVLARYREQSPIDRLGSVIATEELLAIQKLSRRTHVAEPLRDYIVAVVRATREHPDIRLGASTRAALGLQAACQALAACRGREFVIPDDVKELADSVLSHRIILTTEARLKGRSEEKVLQELLGSLPVPVET